MQTGMPGSLAVSKVKTSTIRRRGRGPVIKTKKESVFTIKNSNDSTGPSLVYFEMPEVSTDGYDYMYDLNKPKKGIWNCLYEKNHSSMHERENPQFVGGMYVKIPALMYSQQKLSYHWFMMNNRNAHNY